MAKKITMQKCLMTRHCLDSIGANDLKAGRSVRLANEQTEAAAATGSVCAVHIPQC